MMLKDFKTRNLISGEKIIGETEDGFRFLQKAAEFSKNTVLVLSFALLTGAFSQLKAEIGIVPVTMQTIAVLLSGALLGKEKAMLSQTIYLLGGLGAIPWFSRGGGINYILSPSFGYILGFIISSFFVGLLFEKGFNKNIYFVFLTMISASLTVYLPGLLWLALFVKSSQLLTVGFYPFIIGDILKSFLATFIYSFIVFGKGKTKVAEFIFKNFKK